MTAFLMLNCCLPPLSRFTTAPLNGSHKPLLEERWHEVTEWRQKGRCCAVPYEVNVVFGRPMIAPTNCIFFCISHTYNRLPLRGADGGAV